MPELKIKLTWTDGTNTKDLDIMSFDYDRQPNSVAELNVRFSNKDGIYNYFFKRTDEVKFYVGIGALPQNPLFTGYPASITGMEIKEVTFLDYLGLAQDDWLKLDVYSNYDGDEVSVAMKRIIDSLDGSPLTFATKGTNPIVTVPNTFRYERYETKLNIIDALNDLCWDKSFSSSSGYLALPYFYYVDGTSFYHVKQPHIDTASPVLEIDYADDLLTSDPEYSWDFVCNKCTYIGASYEDENDNDIFYEGTFTDISHGDNQRLKWVVKEDDGLTSNGDCYNEALRYVQANKTLTVKSSLNMIEGYDLIPGISVVRINNSRWGIEGKHLVTKVNVLGDQGSFQTNIELTQRRSVITDYL